MKNLLFSIIIPHKNSPDLLQRCLNSIPRREDIQIIVVDDNSDEKKVDFNNFPGLGDKYVEVYLTKESKGAGYARNLGMKHAKGKWLIFADADDFFMPCFNEALDKYKNDKNDIIYFYVTSVDSETLKQGTRHVYINRKLSKIQKTNNWNIGFQLFVPWGKFIKREIVEKNNIVFQEVQYANDVLFSIKAANNATKKIISNYEIYCITYRLGSLENTVTIDSKIICFQVLCDTSNYLKLYRKDNILKNIVFLHWFNVFKIDKKEALKCFHKMVELYGIMRVVKYSLIVILHYSVRKLRFRFFRERQYLPNRQVY